MMIKLDKMRWQLNSSLVLIICALIISQCSQPAQNANEDLVEETTNFVDSLAIPDFTIYTYPDSSSVNSSSFTKEGIIVIKYFSPDCENCQEEAEAYFSRKDSLQHIRTIWVSGDWAKLNMIKEFALKYNLEELNAIAVGKEVTNDLVAHYGLTGVPFAAVYVDNQLVNEYTGSIDFDELIELNFQQ